MENNNQQNKKWLALLSSSLVCLLGAVVWGVLYVMGWFASPVAFVTAFGAFFVYEKFNKEITKGSFIWVLVWVIVLNIIASFLAMVVAVAIEAEVSLGIALNALLSVFNEFVGSFVLDTILGTAFGVLGVVVCYKYLKKKKQAQNVQESMSVENQDVVEINNEETNKTIEPTKCSKCGAEISGDSDTCEFCGSKRQ